MCHSTRDSITSQGCRSLNFNQLVWFKLVGLKKLWAFLERNRHSRKAVLGMHSHDRCPCVVTHSTCDLMLSQQQQGMTHVQARSTKRPPHNQIIDWGKVRAQKLEQQARRSCRAHLQFLKQDTLMTSSLTTALFSRFVFSAAASLQYAHK
jgi:hypothetical protein